MLYEVITIMLLALTLIVIGTQFGKLIQFLHNNPQVKEKLERNNFV